MHDRQIQSGSVDLRHSRWVIGIFGVRQVVLGRSGRF
jgi:hypothetical protein